MAGDENKFVRTSSGVWKPEATSPGPGRASSPSALSSPSGVRSPSSIQANPSPPSLSGRGLPASPKDRGAALAERARQDRAKGNLASAETNLRLAISFNPGDETLAAELKAVVDERDKLRRAGPPRLR